MSELPLPEIELFSEHSFKEFNQKKGLTKKPPKLYPKHDNSFNKKSDLNISMAHKISFKDDSILLSPLYQKDNNNQSYYDECFEQIVKIGEGSFAEVYKVRSKKDGKYYAIKKSKQVIRKGFYRQERLEEVRRYEQFSKHEHCVKLHKAWEQDELLFMQMELCKCSLEAYVIEEKVIPESMIWSILLDLLLALKSLHENNLIHLDIKLENILITDDKTCKLGDFGLVCNLNRENLHLSTEGDSRYIAPELMLGQFSKAADIFSLGIAILELACNLDLPSNGPLWKQLRDGIFPDVFFNMISSNLKQIITWMMEPDSKNRPTVENLLENPKLQSMYYNRLRGAYFKKIKNISRQIVELLIRKFNDLMNFFWNKYYWLLGRKSLTSNEIVLEDSLSNSEYSILHSTPNFVHKMDKKLGSSRIANLTPINRHHLPVSNLRKTNNDVQRLNFDLDFSEDDEMCLSPNSIKSNWNNSLESSSFVGKKLFFKVEDSD